MARTVATLAEIFPTRRRKDTPESFRFRLKARNGEIIATGEAYTRRRDAVRGARRVAPSVAIRYVTK